MPTALITCLHLQRNFDKYRSQYEALGITPVLPSVPGQQLDADGMRAHIADCDAVIAGDDTIDESVLEAGKAGRLKAVIKWGIGTDSIDKAAAKRLGIPVYNTPGVFSDEVADLAMSLLLMQMRGSVAMHQSIVEGGWLKIEGRSLSGLTAGVIGLGSIGLGIARRAAAFGMGLVGYDVYPVEIAKLGPPVIDQLPFDEVLARADVLFLACNLTAENRHLMNRAAFAHAKPGVIVVNVARGPLVDETALCEALASGRVGGAALDVFETEPLPMSSPLRAFKNVVFATHNGSNTREAVARINQMTSDILFQVLGLKAIEGFVPNRVA